MRKEVKTIRLTEKQDELIQWYADKLGISWAEALRRILDTYIEAREQNTTKQSHLTIAE